MYIGEFNVEPDFELYKKIEFEPNFKVVELEFEPEPCDKGYNYDYSSGSP